MGHDLYLCTGARAELGVCVCVRFRTPHQTALVSGTAEMRMKMEAASMSVSFLG